MEQIVTLWVYMSALSLWMMLGCILCAFLDPEHWVRASPTELTITYLFWPVTLLIALIDVARQKDKNDE